MFADGDVGIFAGDSFTCKTTKLRLINIHKKGSSCGDNEPFPTLARDSSFFPAGVSENQNI